MTQLHEMAVRNTNIRIRVSAAGTLDVWVNDFDDPNGKVVASSSATGVRAVEDSMETIVSALLNRRIGGMEWQVI